MGCQSTQSFAITVKHLENVGTWIGEDAAKARGMLKAIKAEKIFVVSP